VSTFVEADYHVTVTNLNGGGQIQHIPKEFLGLGMLVFTPNAIGHETVQRTGHQSDLQIEVHLESDHRRERIDVKELDRFRDAVFDQHTLRVAGH